MIICTVADQGLFVSLHVYRTHYANMSMYYAEIFKDVKMIIFSSNFFIFFLFCSNIDCGHTLEPPQRAGSNEYPQSMF